MPFAIPTDIRALNDAELADALSAAYSESAEFGDLNATEITSEQEDRIIALGEFVGAAKDEQAARSARADRYAAARTELTVEPEPVVSIVAAAAATQHGQPLPIHQAVSMVASANVPNFSQGHQFSSLTELGEAVMARVKSLPRPSGDKIRTQFGVAQLTKGDRKFVQGNDYDVTDLLIQAANEHALPGGSLVAAGGWGSPSETLYDLCTEAGTAGLIDLPEIGITRGGISYTRGVTLADVMGSATGFIDMTEVQAEAGVQKTYMTIDDPVFEDVRLDAVGLAIEAGILLRSSYPEVIKNVVQTALIAQQHKVSAKVINKIIALIASKKVLANGFGNALDVLHIIEMVAMGERQRYRLVESASLEVVLPMWIKSLIRADLANRNGVDKLSVPDSQIVGFFSARNLRVQFVYNWQHIDLDSDGIATAYPNVIQSLIYPAGTYVKGASDVLTLDTVYDSTNLKLNRYVELFTEEGILVANQCGTGRHIEFPICANGTTGSASIATCFSSEPVVGSSI